jgi:hypothetical protein
MLQVETVRPHPLLAPYVSAFVQRDFRMQGAEAVQPVVARLGMMLEFQFRDPYWIPSFRLMLIVEDPDAVFPTGCSCRRVGSFPHARPRLWMA